MKRVFFEGMEKSIPSEEFNKDVFDIYFWGVIMVQFTKQEDGSYKPTNAMNGGGYNCFESIKDKELIIID